MQAYAGTFGVQFLNIKDLWRVKAIFKSRNFYAEQQFQAIIVTHKTLFSLYIYVNVNFTENKKKTSKGKSLFRALNNIHLFLHQDYYKSKLFKS